MTLKSLLGLSLTLGGVGLSLWAALNLWLTVSPTGQQVAAPDQPDSRAAITVEPTPLSPTSRPTPQPTITPTSSPTSRWRGEPIVPTAPLVTVSPTAMPVPTQMDSQPNSPTVAPVNTASATPSTRSIPPVIPTALPPSDSGPALLDPLERFGLGVPLLPFQPALAEALGVGWYLAWRVQVDPPPLGKIEFWQMIRLKENSFWPDEATISQAAQNNPGATWLIGNEPDVRWQDNVTPERYAEHYHRLYHLLKQVDPTCRVAIGGVTQPTPLRLQYLERILAAYEANYGQEMPVDVWNIHNFILPEKRDDWGVDVPPGFTIDEGTLYPMEQHDDMEIFKAQIVGFRRWMAERDWQDKPLIVSEYGILMPEDYGFPPERVQAFLVDSYDYMLTATDPTLGYPADGYRLVQRWAWFSLADPDYRTGNLIELEQNQLTPLGQVHREFIYNLQ